jgi:ribosome-associated toxin RatA of RatAB toxin-antitoxin module
VVVAQHIEKTGEIDAPLAKVYQVVADVERYPEFLPGVDKVTRLEGDLVEMTVRMGPVDVTWTSRAELKPYESIVIELVKGPFRQMDVRWEFTPQGDRTLVRYVTDFELSLPVPGIRRIAARAIKANADLTMRAFRQRVLSL